jgi:hypothetical protein
MEYADALRQFGPFGIFDFSNFFAAARTSREAAAQTLHRWVARGWLTCLRRGLYAFPDDISPNPPTAERVANFVCKDSYVTGLWRMNQAGLIPEGVMEVTSATRNNPAVYNTPCGRFAYRHLKAEFFFGYQIVMEGRVPVKIARPEKAILDFFWWREGQWNDVEFERWRIQDPFRRLDFDAMTALAEQWGAPRLKAAAANLKTFITARYGP